MEESWHLKTEISSKLQREMDNLAVLQDSLKRSDAMTKNMLSILDSFESRLGKLEETIIPIYQETGNLQRRHENSDKTLALLDHVIGYYHVAEEVEPVIRDGPGGGLARYMQCMDKLRRAVQYLTVNNPNSSQLSHVMTLYEAGKDAMEKEFRNLLARHGRPVPPGSLLDVLALEHDGMEAETASVTVLEQLPESVLNDLRQIANWLLCCGYDTDFMQVYATVRSPLLVKSLHTLRDHLKSASKDSGSAALAHSPAITSKQKMRDTPVRKASMRMAFVRKSSTSLKKSNLMDPPGLARQSNALLKEEGWEIDIDFYVMSVLALLKLIQSEATLMQGIVPEKHQRRIFDQLIQSGLDLVIKEGEMIGQFIHRATMRHSVTAVIHLFPVLRQLRSVKPEFDVTLEGCQAPTRSKLASLISSLDATGAKALEEFIDNIRNDPDKQSYMPKDGTVHELTSNTILFLEQLLDFADTAGAMLLTQDPTSLPNVQNVDRLRLKLAEFITKVLSSLGLNLNNKAEAYSDPALKSVFMLNNFTYILKSLRRSGMLGVVHMWNDEVEGFYNDQIINQKRIYSQSNSALLKTVQLRLPEIEKTYLDLVLQHRAHYKQSWSRVLHYISENQKPCSPSSAAADAKMKEKDKSLIKEKFMGFNREMEDIHRVQKAFAIPDTELRDTLREDNKQFIMPYYRAFLQRYRTLPFTRNRDKYIKYSEQDVCRFIDGFFDAAS